MENLIKPKVLIADDMAMDREVLTELLEDEFEVTAVADGGEAVRELDANPDGFACVLLDIFMPVKDGFAVLAHMREKGYETPVIALTSLTDSEGHIRCYEAGVSELLEKPYDRKVLLYKVKMMIRRADGGASRKRSAAPASSAPETVPDVLAERLAIFKAFHSDLHKCVAQLREAIAKNDNQGLHAASHGLQGLESGFGAVLEEIVNG